MLYERGDFGISIKQVDGFGKKSSLWVCNKNCMCKVASFVSEEKAEAFLAYLDWVVFGKVEPAVIPEEEKRDG